MMGTKERNFQPLPEDISLEDLVPEDNFYRRLQQKLDLSFVRELVEDRYAASGRPSVDDEVFFRLQLVMFYEGIRSERELMRIVSDRLSVRWYVGYDLHEPLPDHSSQPSWGLGHRVEGFGQQWRVVAALAGAASVPRGMPSPSTIVERLRPCLPRSTGLPPAFSPSHGALVMQQSTATSESCRPQMRS